MSINKRYVPCLETVEKQYNEYGHNAFIKSWYKTEIFMGNGESIEFINSKLKEGFREETLKQ